MEKTILIENIQIQQKLNNFVKTCDSLLASGRNVNTNQQAITAYKVLLRFLKTKNEYLPIYEAFSQLPDVEAILSLARKISENNCYTEETVCIPAEQEEAPAPYRVGETVLFGTKRVQDQSKPLEWEVLRSDGNRALLLAKKSFFWEEFDAQGSADWQSSSLRAKLNTSWISDSFSEEEKALILPQNGAETHGGAENDLVFLLTASALTELMPSEEARKERTAAWWLCPEAGGDAVPYVQRTGELTKEGFSPKRKIGVRPAMWIQNPTVPDEADAQRESEPETVKMPLKKMIIVADKDDLYIAQISEGDEIASAVLKKFSQDSRHYTSFTEAKEAAEAFIHIYKNKFAVTTETVHLDDLAKEEFEASQQYYVLMDRESRPIVYITHKGKKSFPVWEEDKAYAVLDAARYRKDVLTLAENEKKNLENEFDYVTVGRMIGYRLAHDCDAPHVRYEIFKAQSIEESFDAFSDADMQNAEEGDGDCADLYGDERKYYRGYVEALTHALALRKDYVPNGAPWSLELVDFRDNRAPARARELTDVHPKYGSYAIRVCDGIPEWQSDEDVRRVAVALVDKKKPWAYRDAEAALNLPEDIPLVFIPEAFPAALTKAALFRSARIALREQCVLNQGSDVYTVDPDLVPALNNYRQYFTDESEKEENAYLGDDLFGDQTGILNLRSAGEDSIQSYQYRDNKILTSVKLPNKITKLPDGTFLNCTALNYVTLPKNLVKIGESAFEGCTDLGKLFLPDTMKTIGKRAFCGCTALKSLFLPVTLESIGEEAFAGCTGLTQMYIPPRVKRIADNAFNGCTALKKIRFPRHLSLPRSLADCAYIDFYVGEDENPPQAEKCAVVSVSEEASAPYQTETTADGIAAISDQTESPVSEVIEAGVPEAQSDNEAAEASASDVAKTEEPPSESVRAEKADALSLINHVILLLEKTETDSAAPLNGVMDLLEKELINQ
ncbi:MAG: leucine-rich repeat domain-containing protein [Clostridia bacterium]|nr:leucine-rich repeat domain-containing protein [Clostridia bacterium]